MEIPLTQLPPGDPRLVDAIVGQLKSKGIFDRFRKECLADVDTKPAFLNLRQRVDGQVKKFLDTKTWKNDLNKNHLRDGVRKNIQESGILDTGIDAIINQAVNPKIKTLILPFVEDTVYAFLQIDKPKREMQEYDVQQPIPIEQKPTYMYQSPMPQPYSMYQEMPPLYYPQEIKEEPPKLVLTTELDNNEKEDSIISSESEISVGGKSEEIKPPPMLPSTDLLPMETDVISSGDDDILARASPDTASSISSEHKIGEDVKMDEDNAVDSFDTARGDSEVVTKAVEQLTLKENSEEVANESMDVEKDKDTNKPCGPLFDSGSLDSISSNSSGLSFSPLSANKSLIPDQNSSTITKQCENSVKSVEELRSTQSTPLEDEKSPKQESVSSSEISKSWIPFTLPKDLPSTERTTVASFAPFSSGSIKNSARVVEGASPVSADDSQGSTAHSSLEKESLSQTGEESQESKVLKSEKSEGEITSSSSSSSPKHSKETTSSSRSSYDKEHHKSSKSESYSSRRDSKSSHHDRREKERSRDKSHKSKSDKEGRRSKERHDDHSLYRDKDKHHRRDKDDDKDRDRHSKGHYSASSSVGNSGKTSSGDGGSKEKRERSTDKSSEHKSHSSSHSRSERGSERKHDRSHSKRHNSNSSSKQESSHRSHKSRSSDKRSEKDDKKHKDEKNKTDSDPSKPSDIKNEKSKPMEMQKPYVTNDNSCNVSPKLNTSSNSNSSTINAKSHVEKNSSPDPTPNKSRVHTNSTSEIDGKPIVTTKAKAVNTVRKSLKEDDIFELHLSNTKKDAVLPKPTNSLTKNMVKKVNTNPRKDIVPVSSSVTEDKNVTSPIKQDHSPLATTTFNNKKKETELTLITDKESGYEHSKGSKLETLDRKSKQELRNDFKCVDADSSSSSDESQIELSKNKAEKMKRVKRKLINRNNDDNNNNGRQPDRFKNNDAPGRRKLKRKTPHSKLDSSWEALATELSDQEVVIQKENEIVFKTVTIPLMDVMNGSKLYKKRKLNGNLLESPGKKKVCKNVKQKNTSEGNLEIIDTKNNLNGFDLFEESDNEVSDFEGFGVTYSSNKNQQMVVDSDSSDMELSLLNFCKPSNNDFEGFNTAGTVENSTSADQKLKEYLSQFSADSTFHLNDFLDSDSNEEDYGSEMTVFCSTKGSSKSVIEEIASRTCSNLINEHPVLEIEKSEDKESTTQNQTQRMKRKLSESSCASGSSFSPQSKKSRRLVRVLPNEKTHIDEFISKDNVITSSYSLLTPEEDRTSSKEYEVDLSRRETSYSPLSPASDSSAEELRAKHQIKESSESSCEEAVKTRDS